MDAKALAKSKRTHSQHHSKRPDGNRHSRKLKSPSSFGSHDAAKRSLGKPVNDKTHRSEGTSALPANWDRYEEEFDSGSKGVSRDSASKAIDVILPKSKGADFRHLVGEAQSQANTSLDGFPSLEDVLPAEFNVGLGSLLAIRGQGIRSWIGDDNFVVEDETSGNQEASFISLNLHALAENLAKVDLPKRLFIESDLLPAELCVEGSVVGSNERPDIQETTEESELANRMSEELNLDNFAADQFTSSGPSGSTHAASTFTLSNNSLSPVNYVDVEFQQVGSSGENKAFLPSAEANLRSTEDTRGKHSTFKAAAAEKDLDMLLDSFSETTTLDSPAFESNTSFPVSLGVTSVDPPQISNKEAVSSKNASITATLDDTLDELLEETSTQMNPNVLLGAQQNKSVLDIMQSSSHSGSKSKVSDDFDSWFDTL